jgi:hypothetical protein
MCIGRCQYNRMKKDNYIALPNACKCKQVKLQNNNTQQVIVQISIVSNYLRLFINDNTFIYERLLSFYSFSCVLPLSKVPGQSRACP